MATIAKDKNVYTVIVRLKNAGVDMGELTEAARGGLAVFSRQPGFVSMTIHRSRDGSELLTYLQWRTEADHIACTRSPEVMAQSGDMMQLLQSGRVSMEMQTYEVIESTEGAPH